MNNAKLGQIVKFDDNTLGVVSGLTESHAVVFIFKGSVKLDARGVLVNDIEEINSLLPKISSNRIDGVDACPLLTFAVDVSTSVTSNQIAPLFSTPSLPKVFDRKPFFDILPTSIPLLDVASPIYAGHAVRFVANEDNAYMPQATNKESSKRQALLKAKSKTILASKESRMLAFKVAEAAMRHGQDLLIISTRLHEQETAEIIKKMRLVAKGLEAENNRITVVDVSRDDHHILRMFAPLFAAKFASRRSSDEKPLVILMDSLEDLVADEVSLIEASRLSSSMQSAAVSSKSASLQTLNDSLLIAPTPPSTLPSIVDSFLGSAGRFKDGKKVSLLMTSSALEILSSVPGSPFEAHRIKATKALCASLENSIDTQIRVDHQRAIDFLAVDSVCKPASSLGALLLEVTATQLKRKIEEIRRSVETSRLKSEIGIYEDIWELEDANSALACMRLASTPLNSEESNSMMDPSVRALLLSRAALTLFVPSVLPTVEELRETARIIEENFVIYHQNLLSKLMVEISSPVTSAERDTATGNSGGLIRAGESRREELVQLLDEIDDCIAAMRGQIPICRPILI